jgi:uncharacterized membrane protein YeiH
MGDLLQTIWKNLTDITIGSFLIIDLIAATTNAFNGAILVRRPDHYKHFTIVGITLLAILGGIGGGIARDVLLNDVPAALENSWYLILCVLAAELALMIDYRAGQRFREGMFQFMTAFSLPWYAAIGTDKALGAGIPLMGVVMIGVVGPTTGRWLIDVACGLTPKHLVRGEWFVGTAVLTSVVYIVCHYLGLTVWPATLIAVAVGFSFRLLALFRAWEEPEPLEPAELLAGEATRRPLGAAIREERSGHD